MSEPETKVLSVEKALSGRSTCRATGELIAKGETRVGLEAFVGGRVSMTWQKPLPFLQACHLEHSKSSAGKCKQSGKSFKKGDLRFVAHVGADKRVLLSLEAAAELLRPVLAAVGTQAFAAADFQGLESLTADEQGSFYQAFGVTDSTAKVHEPFEVDSNVKVEDEDDEQTSDSHGEGLRQPKQEDGSTEAVEGENEYERQRREQIARNRARMLELELPALAAQMKPQSKNAFKPRGVSAVKRTLATEYAPRRASLRQRGVSADGSSIDAEKGCGEIVVINGERIRMSLGQSLDLEPRPRHPSGPVQFRSSEGNTPNDDAFLRLLANSAAPLARPAASAAALTRNQIRQLAKLPLYETDVAKMTASGCVQLAFHPCSDMLLLAAADKGGHIGLWHVDRESSPLAPQTRPSSSRRSDSGAGVAAEAAPAKADSCAGTGDDALFELTPHFSYICGLRWAGGQGGGAKLLSCSYDGSVRALDPGAGVFQLLYTDPDAEYSAFECTAAGHVLFVADKNGDMQLLDTRTSETKITQALIGLHDKKVNTLSLDLDERKLASACGDGSIAVWDLRQLKPKCLPLATARHVYTCQSAFFAPDGSHRLLSTSRDNTLRIWSEELKELVSISHNNNTGRWISPFRGIWSSSADGVICGNMKRTVDLYDAATGSEVGQLSHELMSAIPSRVAIHPEWGVLAAATASGRVHCFRNI